MGRHPNPDAALLHALQEADAEGYARACEELAMHLRAALRNGATVEEIRETLLQSAIYCGVPDANTAFRIAAQVLGANGA